MIAYLKCFICVARNSGVILHNYIDDLLRTVYFVANYNIPIEFLWSSVNRLISVSGIKHLNTYCSGSREG
jgi:hypothetical protein